MSLSSIVLNLIGIAVIVFIIMIIYKIIKGILEFFFLHCNGCEKIH